MTIDEEIAKLDLIASDAFEGGDANEFKQLAEWLRELQEFKALFVKANRDVGNVHLDNRAIFEKFFWDCWGIFKAESEDKK